MTDCPTRLLHLLPWSGRRSDAKEGGTINPLTGTPKERHNTFAHMVIKNLLPLPPRQSIMWKLALYILYATGLFASVSAGLNASPFQAPLNSCVLTVQSTVGKVANPQAIIGYGAPELSIASRTKRLTLDSIGILNRFAMSNPPVNPLTVWF